jgi:hypothetical protein
MSGQLKYFYVIAAVCLHIAFAFPQAAAPHSATAPKEAVVSGHAHGPFDVKLTALPFDDKVADRLLARMSIEKQFHGELEGSSVGQMLAANTNIKGSAGYVAIERVTGTLNGRSGSFVLQHNATLTRGTPQLSIIVVPDSGTGQLTGLTGKIDIKIEADGKHFYDFDYTLPGGK